MTDIYEQLMDELNRAKLLHPPYNSAHEGLAVIMEEVDELKAHVWMKSEARDVQAMRAEAVQVAVTALRFAIDICGGVNGPDE